MKNKLTLVLGMFMSLVMMAQSNKEIANVYFKKATLSMEKIDYKEAKVNYEKGLKALVDSVSTTEVAEQGVFIYYELAEYNKAKDFAKQFFALSRSKSSEPYNQMIELYVDIEEKILEKKQEVERKLAEEKAKKLELKKIDSLKKVWKAKESKYTLNIDSLYSFNKKGIALFENNGFVGIMDDKGNKIVKADTYKVARQNEGYFVLIDTKNNPEEVYCYDSNAEKSIVVIEPSRYHEDLSNYGKVTLPRGNGRLVMYPNDISETLVYDFKEEKFIKIGKFKDFLKELKKNDKVDKYDEKERTVKIGKDWFLFGNHLGGQIYSLYSVDNQKLVGYLFAGDDEEEIKIVKKQELGYLGGYYNNKLVSVTNKGNEIWYNNEGEEASKPILNNKYKGGTKVVKTNGGYQLVKEGNVFLRNDKLEKLPDFLRDNK